MSVNEHNATNTPGGQPTGDFLYLAAIAAFDQANLEDPNQELKDGRQYAKEWLYSLRMSEMLMRFSPDSSDAVKLAVRAQHIQRWKIPRTSFSPDRHGYLQWRISLYKFHADSATHLMRQVGYDEETIARVYAIVSKKNIKLDAEAQLMEDVVGLVFLEHYMEKFAAKHVDYTEAKWLQIIRKTWQKMSHQAQAFVLAEKIFLPPALVPLVMKAVQ